MSGYVVLGGQNAVGALHSRDPFETSSVRLLITPQQYYYYSFFILYLFLASDFPF